MFHKKVIMSFLLSIALILGITGCSSNDTAATPEATPAPEVEAEPEVIVEECDEEAVLLENAVTYFSNMPENAYMMKADAFKEQFELARESVFVLDIRKAEDFAAGHLEGALNIPIAEIGQRIEELPKDQEIAIVCYSGQMASQTAGILRSTGYNTKIITGGFKAVEEAGFAIVQ